MFDCDFRAGSAAPCTSPESLRTTRLQRNGPHVLETGNLALSALDHSRSVNAGANFPAVPLGEVLDFFRSEAGFQPGERELVS